MNAFLHIKAGPNGPFQTLRVPMIDKPLEWQKRGLMFTASGYGSRIPTSRMVLFNGKWRRVYVRIYSNCGTAYIGKLSAAESIIVQEE